MFAASRHDPEALPRAIASVVGTGLLFGFLMNAIAVIWLMGGVYQLLLWLIATFFGHQAMLTFQTWAYPPPSPVGAIAELDLALGPPMSALQEAGYSDPAMPGEPPPITEEPPEPVADLAQMDGVLMLLAAQELGDTFGDAPIAWTDDVERLEQVPIDNLPMAGTGDLGGAGELAIGTGLGGYGGNGHGGVESWPELLGGLSCKGKGSQCCIVSVDVDARGRAVDADAMGCDGNACEIDCAESAALAARYAPAHAKDGTAVMGATTVTID